MSRSSIEIEELLTGLIDDRLNDAERLQIQESLRSDAALRASLGALQRNRDLLAQVPTSESPRFDSRIVALAKARAQESTEPLPTWLDTRVQRSVQSEPTGLRKRGLSLAIAVALGFVLASGIVLSVLRNDGVKNDVAVVTDSPNSVAPDALPAPVENAPQNDTLPADASNLAENTNTTQAPSEEPIERTAIPDQGSEASPKSNSIASSALPNNSNTQPPLEQAPVVPEVTPSDANVENSLASSLPNMDADSLDIGIVMVVDVSVGKDVDFTTTFNQLLGSYDIAMAEDLSIGPSVVQTLEKARLLQGTLAEQRRQTPGDSTSLFFVKARAVRIDAMIEAMIGDIETFPEISLDALIDSPEIPLLGELRSVQEAELSPAERQRVASGVASPLRSAQVGQVFAGAARRQPAMPLEARRRNTGNAMIMGDAGNPVSYVLFVIRSPQPSPQP